MAALTVTEKEHWKDRIGRRIDRKIENLAARDPALLDRVKREAHDRALRSCGLAGWQAELDEIAGQRAQFDRRQRRVERAMLAHLRGVPADDLDEHSTYQVHNEVTKTVSRRRAVHEDELLAEHVKGIARSFLMHRYGFHFRQPAEAATTTRSRRRTLRHRRATSGRTPMLRSQTRRLWYKVRSTSAILARWRRIVVAVALEQFVSQIDASGLISAEQIGAVLDGLPGGERTQDAKQLARLLVQQKKLTVYQAQEIYAGRGRALVLGNYVILGKLGQGGMGMVLKAEHRRMKRPVALKILSPTVTKTPELVARFQREVEAAAKLRHPNIVAADDADEAKGIHFLVMEYVDGSDLSALVKEKGPLPVGPAVTCILHAARGLEYAHGRGVVHRDIKPSNLLLAREGTVKILDMGLARLESAGADQDQLTGTGQVMGTIDYMSPEQALDTRHADARADIYSLGITLWYLLTCRGVYQGDSIMAKLLAHREAPIPCLSSSCPDAPPQLDEIFARMVAKKPEDRYQTMSEVIADLGSLQSHGDAAPSPATAPGDDSRLNAFLSNLEQTGAGPAATQAVAAKKQKTAPAAPGVEPTVTLQSNQVETAPESQMSMAVPSIPVQPRRADKRKLAATWFTNIPRSRVGLLGAAGGAIVLLLAAIVFFVQAGEGVIRVEINDPRIEVAIQGTDITLKQADKGRDIKLSPGEKTLVVQRGDFRFETDKLILKKGETVTVRVELLAGQVQVHEGDNLIGQGRLPPSEVKPLGDQPSLAVAPFDAAQAKKHQQAWADYLGLPVEREIELPGGEKLTLVLIPPGEFLMGSTAEERAKFLEETTVAKDRWSIDRINSEGPQHRVRITRPFYLGKYEVTQAQWQSVMGNNPSKFKGNAAYPVEQVSWEDIRPFLAKLNEGASTAGMAFGLPTEAQWEYACRAGTTKSWHRGDGEEDLWQSGWFGANSGRKTHPVGQLRPNGFGLYDMHGNVWEWCADWHAGDYYAKSPEDDPTGASSGSLRVRRGGGWIHHAAHCRSAFRSSYAPGDRHDNLGFRLAAAITTATHLPESVARNFALEFDGEDDFVEIPTLSYTGGPFTIEARVRDERPRRSSIVVGGGTAKMSLHAVHDGFGFHTGVAGVLGRQEIRGLPSTHRWRHLAGVWDGRAVRMFVDGQPASGPQLLGGVERGPRCFFLGAQPDSESAGMESFFAGAIDEVRISRTARYTRAFTPPKRFHADGDTVALYAINEGHGEVLKDSSGNEHHGKIVGAKWVKVEE